MTTRTNIEQARFNMIEQQIRPWDVLDQDVLALLSVVRREDFVPPAHSALAFVDTEIPLPRRGQRSACWRRKVEARLLQELHVNATSACSKSAPARATWPRCWRTGRARDHPGDPPGTGRDGARQPAARRHRATSRCARPTAPGLPAEAPFDVIVLAARWPRCRRRCSQLKVGGRLVAIVGYEPVMRAHADHPRRPRHMVQRDCSTPSRRG